MYCPQMAYPRNIRLHTTGYCGDMDFSFFMFLCHWGVSTVVRYWLTAYTTCPLYSS